MIICVNVNVLKNLSSILLPSLAFTGCYNRDSKISGFNLLLYAPEYVSDLDIKGAGGKESALITVRNPRQGADSVTTWLPIARNGERISEGFTGQVLEEDVKRIVVMSSIHTVILDVIGEVWCITGASRTGHIPNPDIQVHRDSIGDVGYEGNINYELPLSSDPDLVLLYRANGVSVTESRFEEFDIPFMYADDYLEESSPGKAEWMVMFSEVTERHEKGEKASTAIPVRYNALKKKVADNTLGISSVMLNVPYGDSWFIPPTQNYVARLITDAEGRCIYQKNTGDAPIPIDLEEAYLLASDAGTWLNMGAASSLDDLKALCPKSTDIRCFKNGEVYNNNARTNTIGGNDYYKSAIVNSDIVLRNPVKIFHPKPVQRECVHYKQLKQMRSRSTILFSTLITLTAGLFLLGLTVGAISIPTRDVWAALTGGNRSHTTEEIVLNTRLIEIIVALLTGAALSANSLQTQTLFRNPLTGPYVLGISPGVSFGVALIVFIRIGSSIDIVGAAWVGATVVLLMITAVGQQIKGIMVTLILGMMFSSGVGAVVQILQYLSKEESLKVFVIWTMGALGDVASGQFLIFVPSVFARLLLAVLTVKPLNLLLFGEEYIIAMGLNIRRSRSLLFSSTTLLVGAITTFCGPIGFIGLATPHVTRMLLQSSDHHVLLLGTILSGTSILLLCDIISKIFTLPVNATIALLGIPIIMWVVLHNKSITV